jgi:hypothetical protein
MKNAMGKARQWVVAHGRAVSSGAALMLVAGTASAQDDFSAGVLAELSGGKTQVLAILGAILLIISVILLYRMVRKSTG